MLSLVLISLYLLGMRTVALGYDQLGGDGVAEAVSNGAPTQVGDTESEATKEPTESETAQATADRRRDPVEPDFTIVSLPTTRRIPSHKAAFRLTHRFSRPLAQGDFGDFVNDFFGFDSAALIGIEFRFGLMPGTQIGFHRTNDKTIQFFGQQDIVQQGDTSPLGLNALVTVEGLDNFRESYTTGLGVVVSRRVGQGVALYAHPIWVANANLVPQVPADDNNAFLVGLGARVRLRPTVYVVGEFIPRVAGYDPGAHHVTFGIEKRAGGHLFQINFSNSLGTTIGQLARGGASNDNWFIGFNISRKFF